MQSSTRTPDFSVFLARCWIATAATQNLGGLLVDNINKYSSFKVAIPAQINAIALGILSATAFAHVGRPRGGIVVGLVTATVMSNLLEKVNPLTVNYVKSALSVFAIGFSLFKAYKDNKRISSGKIINHRPSGGSSTNSGRPTEQRKAEGSGDMTTWNTWSTSPAYGLPDAWTSPAQTSSSSPTLRTLTGPSTNSGRPNEQKRAEGSADMKTWTTQTVSEQKVPDAWTSPAQTSSSSTPTLTTSASYQIPPTWSQGADTEPARTTV